MGWFQGKVAMTELKPGWKRVKFGDVVRLSKARSANPEADGIERYVGLEHIDPDDLRIRRWGLVAEGTTFTTRFKPGQVLFGKRRAYQRKVAVADFEGVCSGDIYVFESVDSSVLLSDLLPFICQTERFFEYAIGTSAGSLSPRTNWNSLTDYELVLPPIEEQRKITRLYKASNSYCESLHRAFLVALNVELAWLKRVFESYQNLTFDEVSLSKILEKPPESGVSAPPTSNETGHWVLALNALSQVGYLVEQLKPVEPTKAMLSALLHKGDLLISRSNTLDRVGFVGIYNGEKEGAVSFPDTMMKLQVKTNLVLPEYLELYLQSPIARRQITSIAAGTSASMKKINKANLQKLSILLPNLQKQQEIIDTRKQITSGRIDILNRLRQSQVQHFTLINHALSPLLCNESTSQLSTSQTSALLSASN
jgi:type I restriction enzyme, S subunit